MCLSKLSTRKKLQTAFLTITKTFKVYHYRKYTVISGDLYLFFLFRNFIIMLPLLMTVLDILGFILFVKNLIFLCFLQIQKMIKPGFFQKQKFSIRWRWQIVNTDFIKHLEIMYNALLVLPIHSRTSCCRRMKATTHCQNWSHPIVSCLCSKYLWVDAFATAVF